MALTRGVVQLCFEFFDQDRAQRRTCVDCGVDISGRGRGAVRCEDHYVARRNKRQQEKRAENPYKARENERRRLRAWRAANPDKRRKQLEREKYVNWWLNIDAAQQRTREREIAQLIRAEEKERRKLARATRVPQTKEQAAENQRRYYLAHKEQSRDWHRRYMAKNPEKRREKKNRYRARKLNQLGVISKGIILRLLAAQEYRCAACETDIRPPQPYHLDHIIPLARGGMHDDSNLQCLCPPCNQSKGAKLPAEWEAALAARARLSH